MEYEYIKILNLPILSITRNELLQHLHKGVLVTPNVDHLVKLQQDKELYDCYRQADWVICDSRILYFLSHLLKRPIVQAIPGSSFFTSFYMYHRKDEGCKIFLLGAAEGIAEKAQHKINAKVGREIIVDTFSPSFGFEKKEEENRDIIRRINESGANVLVVGLGAPKQEKWMIKNRNQLKNIDLLMGLGATIDFEAGAVKRAPAIFQRVGLEWFYRFMKEPRRLFRRYFIEDPKFFYLFFLQITGRYRNPFEKRSGQ